VLAPAVAASVVEPTLPGITQYRTHVPIKVTNVQLLSPPVPANSVSDDNIMHSHDVLLKGM